MAGLDAEDARRERPEATASMPLPNPVARPDQPTLADVIARIKSDAGLSHSQRTRAIRDLKTACRWFGLHPVDVIAHPMNLRPRFKRLSPGGLGVSTKRIQNVRSSMKMCLTRLGLTQGRSFKVALTPQWQMLIGRVDNDYCRKKLHCIASFASAKCVLPGDVDDAFSNQVLEAMLADRLHASPRIVHQNAVRAWNATARRVPALSLKPLIQPMYRKVKSPAAAPHPSLETSIEGFLARNATDDPFDLSKPIVPWKRSTAEAYRRYLKRYFGLLVAVGFAPDSLRRLSDLVPIDRAKAALKFMMSQNDGGGRIGASHIARLLAQVAHEAIRQESDLSDETKTALADHAQKLSELADRLHKRNKVLGQKNRERLRPLREEANLAKLFLLPFAVAKEVDGFSAPTRGQAILMQLALALLILTFCPLRVTSLSQLRIDRHLVWTRPGMKGELRLEFTWRELKTEAPEVLPLPPECARLVRLYLERFRPRLTPGSSPFLFPGRSEDWGKRRGVLSGQLQSLIFKRTGFEVNPHLYRHLVHLVVLTRFPGAYAMISRVLTHRSLETAKRNYAYFDVELSLRAYHELIRDVQQNNVRPATQSQIAYDIDREGMRDATR